MSFICNIYKNSKDIDSLKDIEDIRKIIKEDSFKENIIDLYTGIFDDESLEVSSFENILFRKIIISIDDVCKDLIYISVNLYNKLNNDCKKHLFYKIIDNEIDFDVELFSTHIQNGDYEFEDLIYIIPSCVRGTLGKQMINEVLYNNFVKNYIKAKNEYMAQKRR